MPDEAQGRHREIGDPRLPRRRAVAPRQLRPQARGAGRGEGEVRRDRHEDPRRPLRRADAAGWRPSATGSRSCDRARTATITTRRPRTGCSRAGSARRSATTRRSARSCRTSWGIEARCPRISPCRGTRRSPGSSAESAFLGGRCESFKSGDPNDPNFRVQDLTRLNVEVDRRQTLRQSVDNLARQVESDDGLKTLDEFQKRAMDLVLSPEARRAFDIRREDPRLRDRYGRTTTGQSCLLARRLVESGVRFVTVNSGGWDHHANIFQSLDKRLPEIDACLSSLIEDLDSRGLLDSTLVLCMGEFGRSPKVNKEAGRDHWGHVASLMWAGGGVKGGRVIGASDDQGAYVTDRPIRPADVAATIYQAVGVDPIAQPDDAREPPGGDPRRGDGGRGVVRLRSIGHPPTGGALHEATSRAAALGSCDWPGPGGLGDSAVPHYGNSGGTDEPAFLCLIIAAITAFLIGRSCVSSCPPSFSRGWRVPLAHGPLRDTSRVVGTHVNMGRYLRLSQLAMGRRWRSSSSLGHGAVEVRFLDEDEVAGA